MSNSFGTNFVLVNKVRQLLPSPPFINGPWSHVATVVRGIKEYCAFVHEPSQKLYIEEVDPKTPNLFIKIETDTEWADLYRFLMSEGVLTIESNTEMLVGPNWKMHG